MTRDEINILAESIGPDIVRGSTHIDRTLSMARSLPELTERDALVMMVQVLHGHATDMRNRALRLAELKAPTFITRTG